MSSTIKLYEHNQKAYDALLDMLGERDRACVIKPTGTGKFVIIAKMVQDNPDKRFLLLGTNDYMFNDQMANLAEIAPGFTPEGGRTHHGHHERVHVVHGKALQAGGCRRPHRIRVDGQGARVACRRARDACRAAMARTMARSRVDTCLGV